MIGHQVSSEWGLYLSRHKCIWVRRHNHVNCGANNVFFHNWILNLHPLTCFQTGINSPLFSRTGFDFRSCQNIKEVLHWRIIRLCTLYLFSFNHTYCNTTLVSSFQLAFIVDVCVEFPLIKAARSVTRIFTEWSCLPPYCAKNFASSFATDLVTTKFVKQLPHFYGCCWISQSYCFLIIQGWCQRYNLNCATHNFNICKIERKHC